MFEYESVRHGGETKGATHNSLDNRYILHNLNINLSRKETRYKADNNSYIIIYIFAYEYVWGGEERRRATFIRQRFQYDSFLNVAVKHLVVWQNKCKE